uniref:Uncharacterized protein n=1 Tax=Glossina pallidipes TaxID=7398 RepID=A0A1B0A7G2_GLOPL
MCSNSCMVSRHGVMGQHFMCAFSCRAQQNKLCANKAALTNRKPKAASEVPIITRFGIVELSVNSAGSNSSPSLGISIIVTRTRQQRQHQQQQK